MIIFTIMHVYMGRAFKPKAPFNHLLSGILNGVLFIVSAVHSLSYLSPPMNPITITSIIISP